MAVRVRRLRRRRSMQIDIGERNGLFYFQGPCAVNVLNVAHLLQRATRKPLCPATSLPPPIYFAAREKKILALQVFAELPS